MPVNVRMIAQASLSDCPRKSSSRRVIKSPTASIQIMMTGRVMTPIMSRGSMFVPYNEPVHRARRVDVDFRTDAQRGLWPNALLCGFVSARFPVASSAVCIPFILCEPHHVVELFRVGKPSLQNEGLSGTAFVFMNCAEITFGV